MKNKKHARRVKRLALICTMCTIILVVSTYAWFIGMRTVAVNPFEVEIAATKGLYLSLNGNDWYETVNINATNYNDTSVVYANNTNTWGGTKDGKIVGLIPMSTVGEINATSSRLTLFEKGSLTTTDGGYRLMASKVNNDTVTPGTEEGTGFVAFDLFVKNLSGSEYYATYNPLNEEAIYLTQNSTVSVKTTGADNQEKTGIENSVRVAFAQIGRVTAETTTAGTITGITCKSENGVTGICDRYAQIWEPNDKAHVANAINWYKTSCIKRTGDSVTDSDSYSGTCNTLADGAYSHTYAVGQVIDYTHNIDVYDGPDYNTYATSVGNYTAGEYSYINGTSTIAEVNDVAGIGKISEKKDGKLYTYDYFTDTEKMLTGMDRPTFMTLAPNSITKVRVYIYLEGQDVDNYDFASLGKRITVSFGFTKERFYGSDIQYNGPATSENGAVPVTPEVVAPVQTVDSTR